MQQTAQSGDYPCVKGDRHLNRHLRTAEAVEQSIVKVANERAVLTKVALNPGIFGAEIARRCGLGPQTVASILEGLQRRGLVGPGEVLRGNRGQPATPYFLAKGGSYAIGCELSWRHCMVQLVDIAGETLGSHRWEYRYPDASTVFHEIASVIALLCKIVPSGERSRILGVALAGPAVIANHVERLGGQRRDADLWVGSDPRRRVEEATSLKTTWFNDGNAACWAELALLPHPRPGSFAYFFIGTTVPSAVIADGRLLLGSFNNAADLGMMLIPDQEGNLHWVASIAGLYALQIRLTKAGIELPKGNPAEWDWDALEPCLSEWIEAGSRAIALAITNTAAVIDSALAVVDGVMPSAVVERYVDAVRHELTELPVSRPQSIVRGNAGQGASSKGAAQLLMFRQFFSGELEHLASGCS